MYVAINKSQLCCGCIVAHAEQLKQGMPDMRRKGNVFTVITCTIKVFPTQFMAWCAEVETQAESEQDKCYRYIHRL